MSGNIEILVLPYSGAAGRTILNVLVAGFLDSRWDHFRAAVAFASASANSDELLTAMDTFTERGGAIEVTFGADLFGADVQGTELAAVQPLVERFAAKPRVAFHLYHERGRIFHPKVYLFSNEAEDEALLIVGSSNWSYGGFSNNVEANLAVTLDLTDETARKCYDDVVQCFSDYWQEPET